MQKKEDKVGNKTVYQEGRQRKNTSSETQPASKLSYLGEGSEPRENARARAPEEESLQRSLGWESNVISYFPIFNKICCCCCLINFHFHPGNPGNPQSVKTVTANVPPTVAPIRQVTTVCQVQTAEGAQNYLLIKRVRSSIKTMFLITEDMLVFPRGHRTSTCLLG